VTDKSAYILNTVGKRRSRNKVKTAAQKSGLVRGTNTRFLKKIAKQTRKRKVTRRGRRH